MLNWHPATSQQAQAADASIQSQLDAFRFDDFEKAVRYQSPGLRAGFRSTAQFRTVMLSQYPAFCHYRSVIFGDCEVNTAAFVALSDVTLVGSDGTVTHARYTMQLVKGTYRVVAVATAAH